MATIGKVQTMHPLHKEVGEYFELKCAFNPQLKLLRDEACGNEKRRLPFFLDYNKSTSSRITNPDIVILKGKTIKLVCEIEESDVKPTNIFGKFSSLICAHKLLLGSEEYLFDTEFFFIQVVKKVEIANSHKQKQWKYIEDEINKRYRTFPPFHAIHYYLTSSESYRLDIEPVFCKL